MTTLLELVTSIAKQEHMGDIAPDARIEIRRIGANKVRLYWDGHLAGKLVRNYADFQFTGIATMEYVL
jgi:hypothetical protein